MRLLLLLYVLICAESAPLAIHKRAKSADAFSLGDADTLDMFARYCRKNAMCESSRTLRSVVDAIKPPVQFSHSGCDVQRGTSASEITVVPFRTNSSTMYATMRTSHAHPVDIVVATFDSASASVVFLRTNLTDPGTLEFSPSTHRGFVVIGVFSTRGGSGGIYFEDSGSATCVTSEGFLVTCSPSLSLTDQPCAQGPPVVSEDLSRHSHHTSFSIWWFSIAATIAIVAIFAVSLVFYAQTPTLLGKNTAFRRYKQLKI